MEFAPIDLLAVGQWDFIFLGIEFAFVNPLGEQVALLMIPTLNDTNSFSALIGF